MLRWNSASDALSAIALAGVVLMLVVLAASGLMRLAASGLGCDDWPACYPRSAEQAKADIPRQPERIARTMHRVAASAVGAMALAAAMLVWVRRPRRAIEVSIVSGALALTLFLAALGRSARSFDLPAVVLGNVAGGTLLLLLFQWLHLRTRQRQPFPDNEIPTGFPFLLLCLGCVQFILATLVSAHQALLSCAPLEGCVAVWTSGVPVFNPLIALNDQLASGAEAAREALVLGQRGATLVLLAATGLLALRLRHRSGRRRALVLALCGALLLQISFAAIGPRIGYPLAMVLGYDLLGITVLMLLVALAYACHRGKNSRYG